MKWSHGKVGAGKWLLVGAVGLTACGGHGGPERFSTSVPAGTAASEFTESEHDVFCQDMADYFNQVLGTVGECPTYGARQAANLAERDDSATNEDLRAECNDRRALCVDLVQPAGPDGCPPTFSSDCQATVADMGACFSQWKAFLLDQHSMAPACETLTRGQATAFANFTFVSPTCAAARAKCPGFLDFVQ